MSIGGVHYIVATSAVYTPLNATLLNRRLQKMTSQPQPLMQDTTLRLKRIEDAILELSDQFTKHLEKNKDQDCLLNYGVVDFREKIVKSCKEQEAYNPLNWLLQVIRNNPDLRFPHRKILEYLSQQYDYGKKQFQEVNHSTIVRGCKLGKNKAKHYLNDLAVKGLIARREDGYRVWYKIAM